MTPSDTADLAPGVRGLYVGGAGNVQVLLIDDPSPVVLHDLAVGIVHPLMVRRVYATGTTATNLRVLR